MIDPNFDPLTIPLGHTYDNGRLLSYRDSDGYWYVYTYDHNGCVVGGINSDGHWYSYTRDDAGRVLTYRDSDGDYYSYTYDNNGKRTITKQQEVV